MRLARSLTALSTSLLLAASITACSSSSSSSSSTTAAGVTTTQASAADCPFTGVTTPSSGGTAASSKVSLTGVTTSKQGCADNLQFALSPSVVAWSIAYATGPILDFAGATVPTSAPVNLVLTLENTEWTGAGATPLKLASGGLDYVTSINIIEGPSTSVLVVRGMNQQVQYVASDSKAPAYVSLGLG